MTALRLAGTVALVFALVACGPPGRGGGGGGDDDDDGGCLEGAVRCAGLTAQTCKGGVFVDSEACATGCADGIGCSVCSPGTGTCSGDGSHTCADDGSGYVDATCDPVQGMGCDANTGQCTGACAPRNLGASYIGCEYYPTITGNDVGTQFDYAVAISNTTADDAVVTIEGGALASPAVVTVPAHGVQVQILPWVAELKLCTTPQTGGCEQTGVPGGALAVKGAYRVRSTQPVTVYQFNALEYSKDGVTFSYSNDASLLIPTNAWRSEYYAASWRGQALLPSELAVTASHDNTQVTIVTRANTLAGGGAPAFTAGVPTTITLNAGDALEIASVRGGDLTGSHVTSDKPVQVIGGHYCAQVPDPMSACDHLEETMIPVEALGSNYVINAPALTTIPSGKVEVIRIIATAPNTVLAYDPPQAAGTFLANAGDILEIQNNAASFAIHASAKVMVVQYMEGQQAGGSSGDPAMSLAVPVEQYRKDYLFHAPVSYQSNYVDVTAPMGANVMLDGKPLALTAIGGTGLGFARAEELTNGPADDGNHAIASDQKVGIVVYGYGQYTSYWYPGGLDLAPIIQ